VQVTFGHFVKWLKTRRTDEFNQHWMSYRARCGEPVARKLAAVHYLAMCQSSIFFFIYFLASRALDTRRRTTRPCF